MKRLIETIQGRIYPNQITKQKLQGVSEGSNFVYNHFLKERIECEKNKQKQPSKEKQERELVQLKNDNLHLKEIYSQVLKQIVRVRVCDAWKKYRERKGSDLSRPFLKKTNPNIRYPRFKTESWWYDSFTYTQNNSFRIEKSQIVIKLGLAVDRYQRELRLNLKLNQKIKGVVKTLTISWVRNKYFANFSCEVKIKPQIPLSEIKRMSGNDRGVRKLLANNEGWKYYNPKFYQEAEQKLTELQQSLDRK